MGKITNINSKRKRVLTKIFFSFAFSLFAIFTFASVNINADNISNETINFSPVTQTEKKNGINKNSDHFELTTSKPDSSGTGDATFSSGTITINIKSNFVNQFVIKSIETDFDFTCNPSSGTLSGKQIIDIESTTLTLNNVNGTFSRFTVYYGPETVTHNIVYNLNDGVWNEYFSPTVTYTEGVGLNLPTSQNISRSGYFFAGWTSSDETNDTTYIPSIGVNDTGDKVFYAKWIPYVAKIGTAEYTTVTSAITAANNGDTITLIADSTENISINKSITLDLNGHALIGDNTSSVIQVKNANLKINDTSSNSYSYFTYNSNGAWSFLSGYQETGNEILYENIQSTSSLDSGTSIIKVKGGAITGGAGNYNSLSACNHGGGLIVTGTNSNLTLSGGNIIGNSAYIGGGVAIIGDNNSKTGNGFIMNGGIIAGNYSIYGGGGVEIVYYSSLQMNNNCKIEYNIAKTDYDTSKGGGIRISGNSELTMTSGSISYNKSRDGAGVYLCSYDKSDLSNFVMSGGTISKNISQNSYGAIFSGYKFTMSGGTISNNSSNSYGGVYINSNSKIGDNDYNFIISGGSITNNISNYDDVGSGVHSCGKVLVSGNATIKDNESNSEIHNLYLDSSVYLDVDSSFVGKVGISRYYIPTNILSRQLTNVCSNDLSSKITSPYDYLFSDDDRFELRDYLSGSNHVLMLCTPAVCQIVNDCTLKNCKFSSVYEALTYINSNGLTSCEVKLISDDMEEKCFVIPQNLVLTLDLNGYVLNKKSSTYLNDGYDDSIITNNGILTIKDSNPNSVHNFKVLASGLWSLSDLEASSLYNKNGVDTLEYLISSNTIPIPGKFDNVYKYPVIQVKGGCITGGSTNSDANTYRGNAITNIKLDNAVNDVVLTITGGNIIGNTSYSCDDTHGAIYNGVNCKFEMSGGTVTGNHSNNDGTFNGAGIYNEGTLKLTSTNNDYSKIIFNKCDGNGGGIYNAGTMTMDGNSLVAGNRVFGAYTTDIRCGGGVYNNGTFTMNGNSSISFNTATRGAGILNKSILNINDSANVSNNNSSYGAGIYNDNEDENSTVTITMNGGSISENNASEDGGGIYNRNGNVILDGSSKIESNNSKNGAGICNLGTLNIKSLSEIKNNVASEDGGGIKNSSTLNMEGGIISNNSASGKGGGIFTLSTVTIKGNSQIINNNSVGNGGGIYHQNGGQYVIVGGSAQIKDNKKNGVANNLYAVNSKFVKIDNSLTANARIYIYYDESNDSYNTKYSVVLDGASRLTDNIFWPDNPKYCMSNSGNDIAICGRVVNQPSQNNNYKYDFCENTYLGTVNYQWYRVINSTNVLLSGNTNPTLNIDDQVFGTFYCVATGKYNGNDDFVFTSNKIKIVPSIIQQPVALNNNTFVVDQNKCAANNVSVSYQWYKESSNVNKLINIDATNASPMSQTEFEDTDFSSFNYSGLYNSSTGTWHIDDGTISVLKIYLEEGDKLVVSCPSYNDRSIIFQLYNFVNYKNLIDEYDYLVYGNYGLNYTVQDDGYYILLMADTNGFKSFDVSIGLISNYSPMSTDDVIIFNPDEINQLGSEYYYLGSAYPLNHKENNEYELEDHSYVFGLNLNSGDTAYITTDDGLYIMAYVFYKDNQSYNCVLYSGGNYSSFTAFDSGTYYIRIGLFNSSTDERDEGSIYINHVGGNSYEPVNNQITNKLSISENGNYVCYATYKETYRSDFLGDTCQLISDVVSINDGKNNITVSGTTVLSKIYDGTTSGVATIGSISGIALSDIGKVNVVVDTVTFDSTIVGLRTASVSYKLTGDAATIAKYNAPADSTGLSATITAKDITINADDLTMNLGDSVPTFTATADGLVGNDTVGSANNDTVKVTFNSVTPSKSGYYRIVVSADNADQGNYHITGYNNALLHVVDTNNASVNDVEVDLDKLNTLLDHFIALSNNATNHSFGGVDLAGKNLSIDVSIKDTNVDQTDVQKIENTAGTNNKFDYHNVTLSLNLNDGSTPIDIGDQSYELLPIAYDFDFTRRYDIHVYRVHNGVVDELTVNPNANNEYVVFDYANKCISVWAKKYSTYSITYKEMTDTPIETTNTVSASSSASYKQVKTCVD